MSILWQAGYVIAIILGLAYLTLPKRVHTFGFESLRHSSSDRSTESHTPAWIYQGLGVLLLFIGVTGIL